VLKIFRDMLEAFALQAQYGVWIDSLKGKRAVDLNKKECLKCGYCCARRPCIPTPEELRNIAKFLDMNLKEMVNKLFVCDSLPFSNTKYIFPAKTTQLDIVGSYITWKRTYDEGYCIFNDPYTHLCKIYPVQPRIAKETNCWEKGTNYDPIPSWENINLSEFGIEGNNK